MTDLEARAEQLVDAVARDQYPMLRQMFPASFFPDQEWDELPESATSQLCELAAVAFNVVRTEREMVPCDECGEGSEHRRHHLTDRHWHDSCHACRDRRTNGGAGRCFECLRSATPGQVPGELLVVGLIGGEG